MATIDHKLPDGWICKKSSRQPNRLYYYNTKTGKSQWEPPNQKDKTKSHDERHKPTKSDAPSRSRSSPSKSRSSPSKSRSSHQHQFKISDKSKDVKRSKTPAQDRLQGVVKKKAVFIENVREMVDKQTKHSDNNKRLRMHSVNSIGAKKQSTTAKNDVLDSVKPIQTVDDSILTRNVLEINKQSIPQAQNVSPDKIRVLFSSKTPAQDRLKSFQPNASVNGNGKSLSFNALNVFHSSFGVSDSTNTTVSDSMDEEMEWEDCVEDSNYTFQQLEDMVVEFFNDPSQSAYIIPDTNVFLDSLAPIKCVMDKDPKYSILVPFVVLQELDSLKSRKEAGSLNMKASRAIRYIYEQLKAKNQRMQGQKATEDNAPIISVRSADDKILNCCLQVQSKTSEVILLTNDINLSNKALMNGIEAITSKQFLEKFE